MADDELVSGLDGLEEAIAKLEIETSTKALKNAMMYASKPMLDDMKNSAPYDDTPERENNKYKKDKKHLVDTIKRRSEKQNGDHATRIKVGVFSRGHAYIAAMLNYGTKHIAPTNWMNKVAARNKDEAITRFAKKAQQNFEKALK
jgi:HK97 gp10 family phage protein